MGGSNEWDCSIRSIAASAAKKIGLFGSRKLEDGNLCKTAKQNFRLSFLIDATARWRRSVRSWNTASAIWMLWLRFHITRDARRQDQGAARRGR